MSDAGATGESCQPLDEDPFEPTGWFIPGRQPVTAAERRQKRIAINLSFLWLAYPVTALAQSDASALHVAAALAGMFAFIAVYNWTPFERPPLADPRKITLQLAALTLIATVMTLADNQGWSLLFLFAGISGAMRLPRRAAVMLDLRRHGAHGRDERRRPRRRGLHALAHRHDARDRLHDVRLPAADGAQRRPARRARRGRAARRRRGAAALRARPARPRRPQPVGHRAEGRARRADRRPPIRRSPPSTSPTSRTSRARRSARCARRSAATAGRRSSTSSRARGWRCCAAGIDADLQRADVALPPDVEALLAWTVREGTTNVIRHSGATQLPDRGRAGAREASAEVVDDGARSPATDEAGNGLAGLRERAEQLAGRVEAGPVAEGGFRLRVTVPLRRRDVIRILIAEDQTMVREAIASLLELEDDLSVVAQVGRGDEVLAAAQAAEPDVALLDIEMPGATGLEVLHDARRAAAGLPDPHPHDVRAPRLPAPRDGGRRGGLPAQGRADRRPLLGDPPRDGRRADRRPGPRRRRAERGLEPPDARASRRCSPPRASTRPSSSSPHALHLSPRHDAQPPVGDHGQARRPLARARRRGSRRRRAGCRRRARRLPRWPRRAAAGPRARCTGARRARR